MSGMGDMVPMMDLTDAQERKVDQARGQVYQAVLKVTGKSLYELVDMQGWIDEIEVPKGVIQIPDTAPWEDLDEWQRELWEGLAIAWRSLLRAHVDEDQVQESALNEDAS